MFGCNAECSKDERSGGGGRRRRGRQRHICRVQLTKVAMTQQLVITPACCSGGALVYVCRTVHHQIAVDIVFVQTVSHRKQFSCAVEMEFVWNKTTRSERTLCHRDG